MCPALHCCVMRWMHQPSALDGGGNAFFEETA